MELTFDTREDKTMELTFETKALLAGLAELDYENYTLADYILHQDKVLKAIDKTLKADYTLDEIVDCFQLKNDHNTPLLTLLLMVEDTGGAFDDYFEALEALNECRVVIMDVDDFIEDEYVQWLEYNSVTDEVRPYIDEEAIKRELEADSMYDMLSHGESLFYL
jgi:hypothetical protein